MNDSTKKSLVFQLMPSLAKKDALKCLDYSLISGKPGKVSNWEVLEELAELLSDPKFADREISFFRFDKRENGQPKRVEYDLNEINICLENETECRPIS